jgi:hypothetical protein
MQAITPSLQPDWTPWFKLERLIADSLIGTAPEVRDKVSAIESDLRPHSLVLKALCPDVALRAAQLETFAKTIRL